MKAKHSKDGYSYLMAEVEKQSKFPTSFQSIHTLNQSHSSNLQCGILNCHTLDWECYHQSGDRIDQISKIILIFASFS